MTRQIIFRRILISFVSSFCLLQSIAQQQKSAPINSSFYALPGAFPLITRNQTASIFFDASDATVVRIAVHAFQQDCALVSGVLPSVGSGEILKPFVVIAGTLGKNKLINDLVNSKKLDASRVKNKWETFSISIIDQPMPGVKQALVIAGSDPRGTAFGIFELSKLMGVSPLYWWADALPKHHDEIYFTKGTSIIGPPSVKYRGIFINDEDWGLQPWAAKTFEPETGDIGPKTYAKVFELLLRLKANLLWPAMHPSTKAFFSYPGNKKVAEDYSIIIGSSHAEPMLRNNVSEWNEKTMGSFNYLTNKQKVNDYWESRVKETANIDAMYSLGMRGIHDSGLEGIKDPKDAVPLVESIFEEQRKMLTGDLKRNITAIPQAFTAYKEVLDIYDAGLRLPDDVTLVWPDDNYGYIQRLNNETEKIRSGGSGVYYHASYWGRPHDYLWLSSTHPGLIREEMMKAFDAKADRLWVLNVGDIKPLEYNITMFMDMAFDVRPFSDEKYSLKHLEKWCGDIFGTEHAREIRDIFWEYYALAFERKPEFMGWSQTEPTTKTNCTAYNHFYYGDQAQKRINRYDVLQQKAVSLRSRVVSRDAYYQLVYYPVVCAALMNKKFLYRDKSYYYSLEGRSSASDYAIMATKAYDSIAEETAYYNDKLSSGKWKFIMSMKPRSLPVYLEPVLPESKALSVATWGITPEGKDSVSSTGNKLPVFDSQNQQSYFIDVWLGNAKSLKWKLDKTDDWLKVSESDGVLVDEFGKRQKRLWVSVDWTRITGDKQSTLKIGGGGEVREVAVAVVAARQGAVLSRTGSTGVHETYAENNGYVSMVAGGYRRIVAGKSQVWKNVEGMGSSMVEATIPSLDAAVDTVFLSNHSFVEYEFYSRSLKSAVVTVSTLPTHPFNKNYRMRYAVSIDDATPQMVNFQTFGRSEEWKQNVLNNSAERRVKFPSLPPGKHLLRIYCVDPGVILKDILVDFGGLKPGYGSIPETKSRTSTKK